MTLEETIDALRFHLEAWYTQRITIPHDGSISPKSRTGIKPIRSWELGDAVKEFMKLHPECKEHEFDIYYDFVVVDGTYESSEWSRCLGGCDGCTDMNAHVRSKGVKVEKMDWEKVYNNAFAA